MPSACPSRSTANNRTRCCTPPNGLAPKLSQSMLGSTANRFNSQSTEAIGTLPHSTPAKTDQVCECAPSVHVDMVASNNNDECKIQQIRIHEHPLNQRMRVKVSLRCQWVCYANGFALQKGRNPSYHEGGKQEVQQEQ